MHFKGKAAAVILAALVTVTTIPTGLQKAQAATSLKDLDSCSSYAREAVTQLNGKGIVEGSAGYFYPQKAITRAELVKLIVLALNLETTAKPSTSTFQDVPLTHWSNTYVETAFRNKIIEGVTADKFQPDRACTREEMAAMFVRSLGLYEKLLAAKQSYKQLPGFKDKANVASWADEYMEFALSNGLLEGMGNGMLSPKGMAKREQAAVITERFLEGLQELNQKADDLLNANRRQFGPLYQAMTLEEVFKGDAKMKMDMQLKNLDLNETMATLMDMQAKINGNNVSETITMKIKMPDGTETTETVQSIMVNGVYYIKQGETGEWEKYTADEAEQGGLLQEGLLTNLSAFQQTTDEIQKEFPLLPITDKGMVDLDGVQVHQYDISLDSHMIGLLSTEELEDMVGGLDSMKLTIYVDNQFHTVKQTIALNGAIREEGINLEMTVNMDVALTNWGTEYTITPPIQ